MQFLNNNKKGKPYLTHNLASQLLLILAAMLIGNLIFFGISGVFTQLVWGFDLFENAAMLANGNNTAMHPIIRFVQAMQTTGMFLLPGIAFSALSREKINDQLLFREKVRSEQIFLMLLIVFIALPMINGLAALNSALEFPESLQWLGQKMANAEDRATQLIENLLNTKKTSIYLLNLLIIAVIPAFAEEILFRGVIQNVLEKKMKNAYMAVIVTSVLFSAIHIQFFTFLPRFVLGMMLGLVYLWSRNLWLPVLFHFFNNGLSVTAWYVLNGDQLQNIEQIGTPSNIWFSGIISIILTTGLMFYIKKTTGDDQETLP